MSLNLVDHAEREQKKKGFAVLMYGNFFKKTKHANRKLRNRLNDRHTDGQLSLTTSSLPPDIERLSSNKQHLESH